MEKQPTTQAAPKTEPTKAVAVIEEKDISTSVLARVNQLQQGNALRLPADYSPENALKSAYLMLQDTVDREKTPVLTTCDKTSIANCLFEMVVRGLNPSKKQVYFIAYGKKLTLSPSYFGNIATAKRCGMKEINSEVIYNKDEFSYEVDKLGRKQLVSHKQELENIDIKQIKGAYAVVVMDDGTNWMEVMTMAEIKQAWMQGAAKGTSGAHTNFANEMAEKSV
ncbi:MAG: RecT family recombinase, partial [archaeon]